MITTTSSPRRRFHLGASGAAVLAAILTSCSLTPEECDPADDSLRKTLLCQKVYAERLEQRKEEVAAAERATQVRQEELGELGGRRAAIEKELSQLEDWAGSAELRVERLREVNRVSEWELASLDQRVREIGSQLAVLEAERPDDEERVDPAIEARLTELRAEEEELERLLLELES